MTTDLTSPDPARFDLASFADLLPSRAPIIGEDPGSFDGFQKGMMQSLLPMTPYEGVIAENLIAIEWELLQHRRMRDAGLRKVVRNHVSKAVVKREEAAHDAKLDEAWDAHEAQGGTEDDWENPFAFDQEAAQDAGKALAQNAVSRDPDTFHAACAEIERMGLDVVELMSEAYRSQGTSVTRHEDKLPDLERRRREVMRDYDTLQKARPIEGEVIEE
jgi:hypothetical protein